MLLGLVQRSEHCRPVYQLYKGDPTQRYRKVRLATPPGSMVIFNDDTLWHAVTPLGDGEERSVLMVGYVTNPAIGRLKRFISNMKDGLAYFGVSTVLRGHRLRR